MVINKSAITFGSLAFALLFGGGVFLFTNLGSLAKTASERIASDVLGVAVRIESMDVSLQDKKVTLRGLKIANPPGFQKPNILTVDDIAIVLGKASASRLEFDQIKVSGTQVFVEVQNAGTNLSTIQSNVKNSAKKKAAQPKAADNNAQSSEANATGQADTPKEPLKVIIRDLNIGDITLYPSTTLVPLDVGTITVPAVRLSGIGARENGIVARDAIAQIWNTLASRLSKSALQAGFFEGLSSDALKDLGAATVKKLKGDLRGEAERAKENFKRLFGN